MRSWASFGMPTPLSANQRRTEGRGGGGWRWRWRAARARGFYLPPRVSGPRFSAFGLPRVGPDAHLRPGAGGDELDGVAQQVGEALRQGGLVPQHARQGPFDLNFDLRRLEGRIGFDDAAQQPLHVHRRQSQFAARQPAVLQHVLDQLVHARGGAGDAVNMLLRLGPAARQALLAQDLGKGTDGPQGRPQVMGDAVRKVLQVADRLLQRGGALGDAPLQFRVPLAQLPLALAQGLLGPLERLLDLLALDGVTNGADRLPSVSLALDEVILDAVADGVEAQRFIGLAGEHDDGQVGRFGPGAQKRVPARDVRQ